VVLYGRISEDRTGCGLRVGRGLGLLIRRGGWRRGLAYFVELAANFSAGILELTDAFAEATRQLGNFVGAKKHQNKDDDDYHLAAADAFQEEEKRTMHDLKG
jgi:hypothetical protein